MSRLNPRLVAVGTDQLTMDGNVQSLTIPHGADRVLIQAEGGDVRYRLDGGTPAATAGLLLKENDERFYDINLAQLKFLGEVDVILNVTFLARP